MASLLHLKDISNVRGINFRSPGTKFSLDNKQYELLLPISKNVLKIPINKGANLPYWYTPEHHFYQTFSVYKIIQSGDQNNQFNLTTPSPQEVTAIDDHKEVIAIQPSALLTDYSDVDPPPNLNWAKINLLIQTQKSRNENNDASFKTTIMEDGRTLKNKTLSADNSTVEIHNEFREMVLEELEDQRILRKGKNIAERHSHFTKYNAKIFIIHLFFPLLQLDSITTNFSNKQNHSHQSLHFNIYYAYKKIGP